MSGTRIATFVLLGWMGLALAQPRSEFEVASIKPVEYSEKAFFQALPGKLAAKNISARALILIAFGVENYQLAGAPEWIGSEQYNLEAKASGSSTIQQMEEPMLQTLLEQRFRLAIHREKRMISGYELRLSGTPKLNIADGTCTPFPLDQPPPPANVAGAGGPTFCGYPRIRNAGADGHSWAIDGKGVAMRDLARALIRAELHAPVADRTGLSGSFDVHLEWLGDAANASDSTQAQLYTALREELGLKLETAKVPVEVVVIDHIEKPSPN